jgi:hypothetical protein
MANAEKLWESFDDILAHRELWDQGCWISAESIDSNAHWAECGTTQCIAGFRCLRDGLRPVIRRYGDMPSESCATLVDSLDEQIDPCWHAARQFDLDCREQRALFNYYTDDTTELKERIQEIIDGKYRDDAD